MGRRQCFLRGTAINLLNSSESRKRVFKVPFTFTPKQIEVENNSARFKILRWGRKTGKTTYAERRAMRGLGPPNSSWWHIAPTYKQAKLISWEKFKRIIPAEAMGKKPNDTDLIITLKNNSKLFLMGSDEPDSLRGPEPDGMTLEEAAYHKHGVWQKVLRPALMPKKGPALFITTPAGYNWFKNLEDEAKRRIAVGDKEWFISHATCYDNPFISRKEIEDARKDCDTEEVWRQEYLAEYESSVGRVFASFSDQRHVRKVELPSGIFDAYRAIDWGMRDDTASLWAFIRNKTLYIYREYSENNMSAPAQAQAIKNQSMAKEKILNTAISHDAAKEDPAMKGLTVMWHFRNAGITPLRPSSRDKKNSRAMIQQLLHENRIVMDPEKCRKLREQLLSYEWKDTIDEKPMKPEDGDDDLIDALHYLVEMLQFELFMGPSANRDQTQAEIMAAIAADKLEQNRGHKIAIPSIFQKDGGFGDQFENSSAGYL